MSLYNFYPARPDCYGVDLFTVEQYIEVSRLSANIEKLRNVVEITGVNEQLWTDDNLAFVRNIIELITSIKYMREIQQYYSDIDIFLSSVSLYLSYLATGDEQYFLLHNRTNRLIGDFLLPIKETFKGIRVIESIAMNLCDIVVLVERRMLHSM